MKYIKFNKLLSALVFSLFVLSPTANAGIININAGNLAHTLTDGNVHSGFDILGHLGLASAPFDQVYGGPFTEPGNAHWQFDNLGAITDTIVSASIKIGIWDLDSAATGNQLDSFFLDGIDFFSGLNTVFEAEGSNYNEFNVFTYNLDNSIFASLVDGQLNVDLDIGGNGYKESGNDPLNELVNNKHFLVYSTLIINTEDFSEPDPEPEPVPEPSTLLLFIAAMVGIRSRIKK